MFSQDCISRCVYLVGLYNNKGARVPRFSKGGMVCFYGADTGAGKGDGKEKGVEGEVGSSRLTFSHPSVDVAGDEAVYSDSDGTQLCC